MNFGKKSLEHTHEVKGTCSELGSQDPGKKTCNPKKRARISTVLCHGTVLKPGVRSHKVMGCPIVIFPIPSSHTHGYQTAAQTWAFTGTGTRKLLCSVLPQPAKAVASSCTSTFCATRRSALTVGSKCGVF